MTLKEEILNLYSNNLLATFSINEIARKLERPYATVYETVQRLFKKEILKKEQKGKSLLCHLNLHSDQARILLSASSISLKEKFKEENPVLAVSLNELTTKLQRKLKHNLISLVLFGSLATGKATKRSDVDLLVIVPNKKTADDIIHRECSSLEMRYGRAVNPVIVTPESFVNMIKSKEENVGKETIKGRIIFIGFEKFWELAIGGTK